MRSKRLSPDEQLQLILECRQSGLSDYQWCKLNGINPGTFYNWISGHRKKGTVIPTMNTAEPSSLPQEVVKLEVLPKEPGTGFRDEQNTCILANAAPVTHPSIEISIGNAFIRLYNDSDPALIETTLRILGGVPCC